MSDPYCISARNSLPSNATVDDYLHALTCADPEIRADDTPPTVDDARSTDLMSTVCRVHEHTETAAHVGGAMLEESVTLHPLAAGVDAATFAVGATCYAAEQFHRGHVQNHQYHYDMMRGALAGLEGRAGDPAVVREAAGNMAFRDGLSRAEAADAPTFFAAVRAVERSRDAGYAAVVEGRDHGPTFERRYHGDLAFHHAVDEARRTRERGGDDWAVLQRRVHPEASFVEPSSTPSRAEIPRAPIRG